MADDMDIMLRLPLKEFLECFPPPQCGRIVDGFQPEFDAHEAFDLPKGSVLNFHRQVSASVPLTFQDTWGGQGAAQKIKVTLPMEFAGKFTTHPYDPETGDTSPDHVFPTVGDLVKVFPVYAQNNTEIVVADLEDEEAIDFTIQCGEHMKCIRLVHKYRQKLLECRLLKETRLRLLPMECVGHFTVLPDNNEYLLSDLMSMLARKRRLRASENTSNLHKIPGVPGDYCGDLFLEEPDAFVEASPMEDPSLIIGLPSNLNITVSPEENSYDRGQLLNTFSTNNRNLFPVVVRVTDWDEETTILENHYVKPGIELVIHGWTRQSKVLAESGGRCFAVPLTYTGKFRIRPQKFTGVSELERAHPAYALRVVEGDPTINIARGDVIRIRREDSMKRGAHKHDVGYLRCEKLEASGRYRDIKLPINSSAVFEEILEGNRVADEYYIRELVSFVTESELVVELVGVSSDQKIRERELPLGEPITLSDFVVEPAIYVSVETAEAPAFHIPLRTLIYVTFVQQLDKGTSPLLTRQNARLSTLDRCVEIIPREVHAALQPRGRGSEDVPIIQQTNTWTNGSMVNGSTGEPSSRYDIVTGNSLRPAVVGSGVGPRQSSFAQSDIGIPKPKGFAAKLKNKFRKHKSTENLHKVSNSEFSLAPTTRSDHLARYNSVELGPSTRHDTREFILDSSVSRTHYHRGPPSLSIRSSPPESVSRPSPPQSIISTQTSDGHIVHTNPLALHNGDGEILPPPPLENGGEIYIETEDISQSTPTPPLPPPPHAQHQPVAVHQIQQPQQPQPQPAVIRSNGTLVTNLNVIGNGIPPQHTQVVGQPGLNVQSPVMPLMQSSNVGNNPMYVMMPTMSNGPGSQPTYMLVPVMQPPSVGQQNIHLQNGAEDYDEDESLEFTDIKFRQKKQFKVAIPADGNLYNFSVKKMRDFFRQLRISEDSVQACLRDKIDGKKFSRMLEMDLERYGLMHPVVVHFRRHTHQKAQTFML